MIITMRRITNREAGMFIIIVQQFNLISKHNAPSVLGGQRKKYSIDDYLYQIMSIYAGKIETSVEVYLL